MDNSQLKYLKHWDSYWRAIENSGPQAHVLWETDPERSAWEDMQRFQPYFDKTLPLLDLGCGSGRQTRFLAQNFQKVIGVDVSPAVIKRAQQAAADQENAEFHVLNAVNQEAAQAFHREFGDVNVYIRGVFHVIKETDRPTFVSSLRTLLGRHGTLYQIELTTAALAYVRSIPHDGSFKFPRVVQPIGFDNDRDREIYYPSEQWELVDEGDNVPLHTITLQNGEIGEVPSNYLILRPKEERA